MSTARYLKDGKPGARSTKGDAAHTHQIMQQYQESLVPSAQLNSGIAALQRQPLGQNGLDNNRYLASDALLQGLWVKPDMKADDEINMWENAPASMGMKMLPYGMYKKYITSKREQQLQVSKYQLGAWLIDPMRPESQEEAYAIVPELEEIPRKDFEWEVTKQVTLYHIIQSGRISSQAEFYFLFAMLDPRFRLPNKPVWDANGNFDAFNVTAKGNVDAGLFSYFVWNFGSGDRNRIGVEKEIPNDRQLTAKALIFQRVFPGLRGQPLSGIKTLLKAFVMRNTIAGEYVIPFQLNEHERVAPPLREGQEGVPGLAAVNPNNNDE